MSKIIFNEEQLAVINHIYGHALVSAVAGSGKTEVLVERTVKLINSGIDVDNILILMFNKSAQEVFLERLSIQLNEVPSVLTFHALGKRILDIWYDRKYAVAPELIEDNNYWLALISDAIQDINRKYSIGLNSHPDILAKYLNCIDILKNLDYPFKNIDLNSLPFQSDIIDNIALVFSTFEESRKHNFSMGLNDFLYDSVSVLRHDHEYAKEWALSLSQIMIDEYQDSNPLQHWIVSSFMSDNTTLMVVGDEDQCIYTWRAADPDMMVRGFEQIYSPVTRYKLSKTFRYGHSIALSANHLLSYNFNRPDKMVISGLNTNGNIEVIKDNDITAVLPILKRLNEEDVILFREFQHLDDIEYLLYVNNIEYRIEGTEDFSKRFMGSLLKTCISICTDSNFRPDVHDAKQLVKWVGPTVSNVLLDILSEQMHLHGIEKAIRYCMNIKSLTANQQDLLTQLLILNGQLNDIKTRPDQFKTLLERLIESWQKNINSNDRKPLPVFFNLKSYIENNSLQHILDLINNWTVTNSGVLLTSIHRSKGGGWRCVFIPHTESDRFPTDINEEERRLFYVAMTRAKKELFFYIPFDNHLNTLLKNPLLADFKTYKGKVGSFFIECLSEYSLDLTKKWTSSNGPVTELITPIARKYEKVLFPDKLKSTNLWVMLK